MKNLFLFLCFSLLANAQPILTEDIAYTLSELPLHCIANEFPNKTSHLSDSSVDARLLPHELHPVFFGCLDWHSSVHGHWMLIKLLKEFPDLKNKVEIIALLNDSFQVDKMQMEAEYFGKYTSSQAFERTYGWAWLLKLDEELYTWNNPIGKKWHTALQPLTQKIVTLWKAYLPKQTYPNRTGVHPNTAFGLCFAFDWATTTKNQVFATQIKQKAIEFYSSNTKIPAYLEPDGTDFFSPSLQAADLMGRVLPEKEFKQWLKKYYTKEGLERICNLPTISDRNDYQIVHLDGLSFSRAWNMKSIASRLPENHPLQKKFNTKANEFIAKALPTLFDSGYGGGHWLASFAIYALTQE